MKKKAKIPHPLLKMDFEDFLKKYNLPRGEDVKHAVKKRGFSSYEDFCAIIGTTYITFYNVINGKKPKVTPATVAIYHALYPDKLQIPLSMQIESYIPKALEQLDRSGFAVVGQSAVHNGKKGTVRIQFEPSK